MTRPQRHRLLIFVLAMAARAAMYAYEMHLAGRSALALSLDARDFDLLANHILDTGTLASPWHVLRPPLYILLSAGLYGIGGRNPFLLAVVNIPIGAIGAVLTYFLARRLTGSSQIALIAGLIKAVDMGGLIAESQPMTEALHAALLTWAFWAFTRFWQRRHGRDLVWCGLALGLATLTRPTTIYFMPLLALAVLGLTRLKYVRHLLAAGAVFYVLVFAWMLRNAAYIDTWALASNGSFTILFNHGVSVRAHALGKDPGQVHYEVEREVEWRLGNFAELQYPNPGHSKGFNNNLLPDTPERQKIMTDMAFEIFRAYPLWFLATLPVGFIRMVTRSLNSRLPVWVQGIPNWLLFVGAGIGLVRLFQQRNYFALALISVPSAVYSGLTLLVTTSHTETRHRTPFTALLAVAAAVAVQWAIEGWRARKAGSDA